MTARTAGSSLYDFVTELHGNTPWGAFLDAGSGVSSLTWVTSLETERWTAVTGSPRHEAQIRQTVAERMRPQDQLLLGNWAAPDFLEGDRYDTVLADYLLGAVEGFAPFFQASLFARLAPLTRRRLYVIGVEPSRSGLQGPRRSCRDAHRR